jgi:NADPH:quinone reductase-like Zn-dependent oxidoreductase
MKTGGVDLQSRFTSCRSRWKGLRGSREPSSQIKRLGGPGVTILEDIAIPSPGATEILMQVKAAGVGPWDACIRFGKSALPQPLPLILGSDLSGLVVAAGECVTGFEPGTSAFVVTNPRFTDAYVEYAHVLRI